VALQETRCSGSIGKKTIKKLGFKNYVLSEARGFSEGIWLSWNMLNIQIQLIHNDFHYLHVHVKEKDLEPRLLTVVYASPRENERQDTWNNLRHLTSTITEPWLMIGDFNEIAYLEKKGGATTDVRNCHFLIVGSMIVPFGGHQGRDAIYLARSKLEWEGQSFQET